MKPKKISTYNIAKVPIGTILYITGNNYASINSGEIDFAFPPPKIKPYVKYIKHDDNYLIPVDNDIVLSNIEITTSSFFEKTNYKVFLTAREATTFYYQRFLGLRHSTEQFLEKVNNFILATNENEYILEHLKQFPEDFI